MCIRCHKMFNEADTLCKSCRDFAYHSQIHRNTIAQVTVLPWLHFDFEPRTVSNTFKRHGKQVNGSCQMNKEGKMHVRIDLYQMKDLPEQDLIKEVVRVIIHEMNHYAIGEIEPKAMAMYDSLNYRELERN
jgi:hypothetical protein